MHVFDADDGGSVRRMHVCPRCLRLPLAAIAGSHAVLHAADGGGRGDAVVPRNGRKCAKIGGNYGGTAAEVL